MDEVAESAKLAIGWTVLAVILWRLVNAWQARGVDDPTQTLYPTRLLVRSARLAIVGLLILFWGIVLGDYLIYR